MWVGWQGGSVALLVADGRGLLDGGEGGRDVTPRTNSEAELERWRGRRRKRDMAPDGACRSSKRKTGE
jgi:hypothetical protein